MAGLYNVGVIDHGRDIESRTHTEGTLTSGFSRAYVQGRVAEKVILRAAKTYVDAQDNQFASVGYYSTQDALLIPLTAKGIPTGVATLGSDGKLPAAQTPVLGAGYVKPPTGPNAAAGGSTQTVPLKIAQWNTIAHGVIGVPWVFMNTSVQSNGGRPVVEVRIGTAAQTAYADQKLIGQGFGRRYYNDYQMVTVLPCDPDPSESADGVQDSYEPGVPYIVNAWLFDEDGETVQTTNTSIASAALIWARTSL